MFEQHRLLGLGGGEVTLFDVTETADFFRDRGECDGEVVVLRREVAGNFAKERAVILKELALGAALGGVAERVESGAAQAYVVPRGSPLPVAGAGPAVLRLFAGRHPDALTRSDAFFLLKPS